MLRFALRRPVLLAGVLLAVSALSLLLFRRRPDDDGPWTVQRLKAALEQSGEAYQSADFGPPAHYRGHYLCRDGTPLDRCARMGLHEFRSAPGRLRVTPFVGNPRLVHTGIEDGQLALPGLLIEGHPDELRRVVEAVRR